MYLSNKIECFEYKSGCGIHEHMHIEHLKEELAWTIDKELQLISNTIIFKIVSPLRI